MMHCYPKGPTVSPHCPSPGRAAIVRGETQKMENYRSQRNRSFAEDSLLRDSRVIALFGFRKPSRDVVVGLQEIPAESIDKNSSENRAKVSLVF